MKQPPPPPPPPTPSTSPPATPRAPVEPSTPVPSADSIANSLFEAGIDDDVHLDAEMKALRGVARLLRPRTHTAQSHLSHEPPHQPPEPEPESEPTLEPAPEAPLTPAPLSEPASVEPDMPQLPPRMPDRPRPTRRTSPVSRETPASPSASSQASAVPSDVSDQPEALLQPARALAELLVPGDHESVERAISALAHFAFASTEPVSMLHRHDALDCAGAFANLINVLSAHREHAGIFGTACSILGSLRVDRLESLKNAPEGGVVAVVQGLQVHKEDYRVCRHGVRALAGFTRLDDVRARLLHRYDGISTVVECMQLHGEVESLYLDSMQFLSFASLHSETNKTEISRGGALRKCLDCLSKWPANRVLHTHVCVIIRNVTVNRPDIIATAEQMQCVESLLDSINTHGNNAVLTTHALAALHHLTTSQEATRRLLRHPTWESTLIDTAKRHASRPTIQALALDVAARVVTAGGPLAARRLVRVGAVKVAIVAMHRFVNRRAVLYCGSRLTRMLLMSGGGSEDVRQCGGVERLLDLLYCTVVAPVSADERYAGYADVLSEAVA